MEELIESLDKLVKVANKKKGILEIEEIKDFSKKNDIKEEQIEAVCTYLENQGVEITYENEGVDEEEIDLESALNIDTENIDRKLDEDGVDDLVEVPVDIFDEPSNEELDEEEEEEEEMSAIELLDGVGTEDPVRLYLKEMRKINAPFSHWVFSSSFKEPHDSL